MAIVQRTSIFLLFLFFINCFSSLASTPGQDDDDKKPGKVQPHTVGSLKAALLYDNVLSGTLTYPAQTLPGRTSPGQTSSGQPFVNKKRSVGAAFAMSALVPGLGQAYNKQWGKAVIGFALEAAIITGAIVWNNQGNGLETDYQQYAHAFWDPAKYATWLNDYSNYIQVNFDASVTSPAVVVPNQIDFKNPDTWSDMEWDVVLDFFSQIQAVEREMFHLETLAAFSHTLPDFSEQQYYELVGKYYQFAPGWEDYPAWRSENGEYTLAIDPNKSGPDDSKPNVPARFFQYADDHAHANDVLRRASRVTTLLLVTHFVGAIEAAVSAKLHNDRITPSLEIGRNERGNPRAIASLRIKL